MKSKKIKKYEEVVKAWKNRDKKIPSDVLGSYTGNPISERNPDPNDKPIQDSDDI